MIEFTWVKTVGQLKRIFHALNPVLSFVYGWSGGQQQRYAFSEIADTGLLVAVNYGNSNGFGVWPSDRSFRCECSDDQVGVTIEAFRSELKLLIMVAGTGSVEDLEISISAQEPTGDLGYRLWWMRTSGERVPK